MKIIWLTSNSNQTVVHELTRRKQKSLALSVCASISKLAFCHGIRIERVKYYHSYGRKRTSGKQGQKILDGQTRPIRLAYQMTRSLSLVVGGDSVDYKNFTRHIIVRIHTSTNRCNPKPIFIG